MLVALVTQMVVAQETGPGAATADANDDNGVEVIVVTGTRLRFGDPTSRVNVIDAEEIARRGLTTAEDVVRSIPQNVATINDASLLASFNSPLDVNLGALRLGVATANLRGLGSSNTLVLVNGRRVAGTAGEENFIANLRAIPAAAIERVEIVLDGGAAIYGSDAVGGVINVVLKQNYQGGSAGARTEVSSTKADQRRFTGYLGRTWDGGSVSGTFTFTESKPVDSYEAGWVTRDLRGKHGLGNDDFYDFRHVAAGPWTSGVVSWAPRSPWSQWPPGIMFESDPYSFEVILADPSTAANAQPGDFVPITKDHLVPFVNSDSNTRTEDTSITLNVEQTVLDRFRLRGELVWTEAGSEATTTRLGGGNFFVPISNAFNNFEGAYDCPYDRETFSYPREDCREGVFVNYAPTKELEAGLIDEPYQSSTNTFVRWSVGTDVKVTEQIGFVVDFFRTESDGENTQFNFGLWDYSAYPRAVEALESSDPSTAVNLFGDGTNQNPAIAELLLPVAVSNDTSINQTLEYYFEGEWFKLPGGTAGFSAGGEIREEGLRDNEQARGEPRFQASLGVAEPNRDLNAYFVELQLPLIGKENARPGVRSLVLSLKARYDKYSITGAAGVEGAEDGGRLVFPGPDTPPKLIDVTFDNIVERFGIAWIPVDELIVTASLSEAFRAPTFGDLFSTRTQRYCSYASGAPSQVYDPLDGQFKLACSRTGANLDLLPETSDQTAIGFKYAPRWGEGLVVALDYSEIDFRDRIAYPFELGRLLPDEVYGRIDTIFIRDENDNLIEMDGRPINIARRVSETIDLDVSTQLETSYGMFFPGLNIHYVLDQFDQAFPDSEERVDFVGKALGVLKYKVEGRLGWARGDNVLADLRVHYQPEYDNNTFVNDFFRTIPELKVDSRTTVDLTGTYRFDNGITARAGGRNIFNADFPFMVGHQGRPFDTSRVDLRGRVLFVEVTYDFAGGD